MSYEPWPGWDDDDDVPWFLLWEICWLVTHTPIAEGQRVLDLGGASSLLSCYLADRGCDVTAIDLDPDLVAHASHLAEVMDWRMQAIQADMADLDLPPETFDHIFSVCVLEHLPWRRRARAAGLWARLLKPEGSVGLTFDYRCPHADTRLDAPDDLSAQLIAPSGLRVRGNREFVDNGLRYLESPYYFWFGRMARTASMVSGWVHGHIRTTRLGLGRRHYTFGALFLAK
jgi:SAM-dependent methyltransferase